MVQSMPTLSTNPKDLKQAVSVSCTCSCVFYNGFLFMQYILALEDIHSHCNNFLLRCMRLLLCCTCGLTTVGFFHGASCLHSDVTSS